jgi:hypothetical protein
MRTVADRDSPIDAVGVSRILPALVTLYDHLHRLAPLGRFGMEQNVHLRRPRRDDLRTADQLPESHGKVRPWPSSVWQR